MEVSKMTMQELLKSLGLEKEKISEITDKMKENKIYTVGEENLDRITPACAGNTSSRRIREGLG